MRNYSRKNHSQPNRNRVFGRKEGGGKTKLFHKNENRSHKLLQTPQKSPNSLSLSGDTPLGYSGHIKEENYEMLKNKRLAGN